MEPAHTRLRAKGQRRNLTVRFRGQNQTYDFYCSYLNVGFLLWHEENQTFACSGDARSNSERKKSGRSTQKRLAGWTAKNEAIAMTAALYARISTDKQATVNQLDDLQKLADFRKLTVVKVVEEIESGAKRRPELEKLLAEGGYDVLLVWALDRLGRGGALEALTIIESLNKRGISVVSVQESWLDTSADNPMRDVLIAFSATIAKMERARLISRTRAGLAVARANGKILGKPSKKLVPSEQRFSIIMRWRENSCEGGYAELGRRLGGVSAATAWRVAKKMEAFK